MGVSAGAVSAEAVVALYLIDTISHTVGRSQSSILEAGQQVGGTKPLVASPYPTSLLRFHPLSPLAHYLVVGSMIHGVDTGPQGDTTTADGEQEPPGVPFPVYEDQTCHHRAHGTGRRAVSGGLGRPSPR